MHETLGGGAARRQGLLRGAYRSAALLSHRTDVRTKKRVRVTSLIGPSVASSYVSKKEAIYEIKGIIGT